MKKVFLVLFLFCFSKGFTQVKTVESNIESNTTSIKISTTSIQGLKNIDWQKLQFLFELNKEKEFLELEIELDLKKSKSKFKSSAVVKGETKNIQELIKRIEKLTKGLIKLAKKAK